MVPGGFCLVSPSHAARPSKRLHHGGVLFGWFDLVDQRFVLFPAPILEHKGTVQKYDVENGGNSKTGAMHICASAYPEMKKTTSPPAKNA